MDLDIEEISEDDECDEDSSGNKENLNISKLSHGSKKLRVVNKSKKILHQG